MVQVGSKTRSLGHILENLVYTLEATISVQCSGKFVRMFVLMSSCMSMTTGHVGLKLRSPGLIFEKPCVCFRGHMHCPVILKFGQNVCLGSVYYEIGSCWIKTRSNLRKKPSVQATGHIFFQILLKGGQNVCLDNFYMVENR